jgi:argininosuccinate synthase
VLSRDAFTTPRVPERHAVAFRAGVPVAWDGEALDPVALVERVEAAAAPFGIGRGIHLGDTLLGIKGRVAFEAPAAEVLLTAHRELEKLVLTGRQQRAKELVAPLYGELVHEGSAGPPAATRALLASSRPVTARCTSSSDRAVSSSRVLPRRSRSSPRPAATTASRPASGAPPMPPASAASPRSPAAPARAGLAGGEA